MAGPSGGVMDGPSKASGPLQNGEEPNLFNDSRTYGLCLRALHLQEDNLLFI
jgi:hypothetical protein